MSDLQDVNGERVHSLRCGHLREDWIGRDNDFAFGPDVLEMPWKHLDGNNEWAGGRPSL